MDVELPPGAAASGEPVSDDNGDARLVDVPDELLAARIWIDDRIHDPSSLHLDGLQLGGVDELLSWLNGEVGSTGMDNLDLA